MPLRHFAKFFNGVRKSTGFWTKPCNFHPQAGKLIVSGEHNFGGHTWSRHQQGSFQWVFFSSQAAIILGSSSMISLSEDVPIESSSDNGKSLLDKIAEDALISNEHTSKWRIFTDSGRDYFMLGNIKQAEKFFSSALQEAKEGFGERDPHVASSCNNLAELYRVKKDYESAEPLYVEAISILEEYYGTNDISANAPEHTCLVLLNACTSPEATRLPPRLRASDLSSLSIPRGEQQTCGNYILKKPKSLFHVLSKVGRTIHK